MISGRHARGLFLILLLVFVSAFPQGCSQKQEEKPSDSSRPAETRAEAPRQQDAPEADRGSSGSGSTEEFSGAATPRGSAPRITHFTVNPHIPVVGTTLNAEVTVSAGEGEEATTTFRWSRNGEVLPESGRSLFLAPDTFRRGDIINLRAIPESGGRKGSPILMHLKVANAPPVITETADAYRFDGRVYTDRIRASDPDGDELTYSLKFGPEGMTINDRTGQVRWTAPPGFIGTITFTVGVSDGHGAEATQIVNFEVFPKSGK